MNKIASAHPRCIYKTSEFIGILLVSVAYTLFRKFVHEHPCRIALINLLLIKSPRKQSATSCCWSLQLQ
jgi:hypothetical protein